MKKMKKKRNITQTYMYKGYTYLNLIKRSSIQAKFEKTRRIKEYYSVLININHSLKKSGLINILSIINYINLILILIGTNINICGIHQKYFLYLYIVFFFLEVTFKTIDWLTLLICIKLIYKNKSWPYMAKKSSNLLFFFGIVFYCLIEISKLLIPITLKLLILEDRLFEILNINLGFKKLFIKNDITPTPNHSPLTIIVILIFSIIFF